MKQEFIAKYESRSVLVGSVLKKRQDTAEDIDIGNIYAIKIPSAFQTIPFPHHDTA